MLQIRSILCVLFVIETLNSISCNSHVGPDPWDYVKVGITTEEDDQSYIEAPPDLRMPLKKKIQPAGSLGNGEWFFRRVLAIMLNGGQNKINDDGSIDISIQMKLNPDRWQTLNECTKSNQALTEEMFRRSIAYVEEAIYKPTITEKIAFAWSEYIQTFIVEYKMYIVWSFGIMAAFALAVWIWKHISHKHIIIFIILALYLYEVIISYKEAEKQDLDRFMSAMNKCSWYFWKPSCEVPPPDPIVFMKHMNPLKIGLRMFTTVLSEPMIAISGTVNSMVHDITDGLWFPFNFILHGTFIISINLMLIAMLIMIIFNYILNIPFSLNLGLGSIQVKQRNRSMNFNSGNNNSDPVESGDRISGATLDKILDVFSRALDNKNTPKNALSAIGNHVPKLKKSSSTGRLPSSSLDTKPSPPNKLRENQNATFMIGGGDSIKSFAYGKGSKKCLESKIKKDPQKGRWWWKSLEKQS